MDSQDNKDYGLLGKISVISKDYSPELLYPIKRADSDILSYIDLDFSFDIWNCYELSWLDLGGKPHVALLQIIVPRSSEYIVESKSLKLYLNSFNNFRVESKNVLRGTIKRDLEKILETDVKIEISDLEQSKIDIDINSFDAQNIDVNDVKINEYEINPNLLQIDNNSYVENERLYSNLLRSNCPVTNQPDWASVYIEYTGCKILHSSLLKYIISFRNHNDFHEKCVDSIFHDIIVFCKPKSLTICAKFTRRGGIDINPVRSSQKFDLAITKYRDIRQ